MTFLLSHEIHEGSDPRHTALLLHGIFGAARNWRSFARDLAARCPSWRIVAADLRHHGASQGAGPPDTLVACAGDLRALAAHLGVEPRAILGHSFGGKVALAYAADAPASLGLCALLDSPPGGAGQGDPWDSEAGRVLRAMRAVHTPAASRRQVTDDLERRGIPKAIAAWLATSLVRKDEGYAFCFDLDALGELLLDYWNTDGYELLARVPESVRVLVVRGERSDRWPDKERARLEPWVESGRIEDVVLPRAAHWLQVDNPEGLLEILAPRLSALG